MYDSASGSELADTIGRSGVLGSHQERPALLKEGEDPECGLLSASLRDSHVPVKGASGDFSLSQQPSPRVRTRALPASRRQKLQRQSEVKETDGGGSGATGLCISQKLPCEAAEKYTLTPAMRKKYLKELFLNNGLHSGLGSMLQSSKSCSVQGDSDNDPGIDPANEENNRLFLALDPVEHAWMLSVVDGNYDSIVEFLSEDPNLLTKRDFVTGFTVIHWLAKHGKHETLIHLMRFAESKDFRVNVNLRASGGLTPLHVATMHGQDMMIKILVGAYSADVDARDYNGKKAWQYLKRNASTEIRELTGAMDEETGSIGYHNANNNGTGGAHYCVSQNTGDRRDCSVNKRETTRFGSFRRRFRSFFSFLNRGQIDSGGSAD